MQTKLATSDSGGNGQFVDSVSVPNSNGVYSRASQEFHNFVSDMEELIKSTASLTGDDLTVAKARLTARIAAARDTVAEISGTITQRVRKSAAVTNNYVHDKPWQAIGIGAAVGVLLGFVIGRRS